MRLGASCLLIVCGIVSATEGVVGQERKQHEQRGTERHERIGPQAGGFAAEFAIQTQQAADQRRAAEAKRDLLPAECLNDVHVRVPTSSPSSESSGASRCCRE